MQTFHVKKNDEVVVIAGSDKGKRGRVIAVLPKLVGQSFPHRQSWRFLSRAADPRQFAQTVTYANPGAEFQSVLSFGRYKFGLARCLDSAAAIVATHDEASGLTSPAFTRREFERYTVLVRK